MRGDAVIQRARPRHRQGGGRRGADEPVQQHGDAVLAGRQDRPGDGSQLAAAEAARCRDRVQAGVARRCGPHHLAFASQSRVVHARAAPGPVLAAEQGGAQRRGGRGVADAHFAQAQQVDARLHGIPPRGKGRRKAGCIHRGTSHHVHGGRVECQRDHAQRRARHPRQLVDRRTAGREVAHHLRRHLGRVGRDAVRDHAVVAGEHHHLDPVEPRCRAALPPG